jgi:peptidoglycan pentaglycine glycine transferase (the first glycine)
VAVHGSLEAMFAIYTETAQRAGFGIHGKDYYETLFAELGEQNYLFYAHYEGKPVAFLWLAAAGRTAYELYGGVTAAGGEIKANYQLKWHAMMAMKADGYEIYDFNGRLNEGVSRFKDGFGPDATDYIGTYDYPIQKSSYHLWEHLWPVAKVVGRRLAKARRG